MYSNIKVTSNLASRIKSLKFSMIRSLIILLINILLVVFYYLGCYIFFATLDQSSSFLMDLSFHAIEL
jgi:amino acid transporter